MRVRKQAKKRRSLFTRAVLKLLHERERELSNGRGVEIGSVEELRKTIRRSKASSAA